MLRAVSQPQQPSLRVVVLAIAVSAPLALGLETLIRKHVLMPVIGPAFEEVRQFFSPQLTRFAWILVGVCVFAGLVGVAAIRRAVRRSAELEPTRDPAAATRKLRDQLLLLSSIPQVPAILATLCFMMGSKLTPVLVSMAVSTAFVLVQGFIGERSLQRADDLP